MDNTEDIRVEEANDCFVCGQVGETLYERISDLLFNAPGTWRLVHCPKCGLAWVNMRPMVNEIEKLYNRYYTHEIDPHPSVSSPLWKKIKLTLLSNSFGYNNIVDGVSLRWLGRVLIFVPLLNNIVGTEIMFLDGRKKGRLLDVGCGNGKFLRLMKDLGWDVTGIEPDSKAADIAREQVGGNVIVSTLEKAYFPDQSFDAITMSHVIEHVHNPRSLIKECYRILKSNGKIVIITPNVESLGHRIFKDYWVSLEPPRHLQLFSLKSLEKLLLISNFNLLLYCTSSFLAPMTWIISKSLRNKKEFSGKMITRMDRINSLVFWGLEEIDRFFNEKAGEEIVVIAGKK